MRQPVRQLSILRGLLVITSFALASCTVLPDDYPDSTSLKSLQTWTSSAINGKSFITLITSTPERSYEFKSVTYVAFIGCEMGISSSTVQQRRETGKSDRYEAAYDPIPLGNIISASFGQTKEGAINDSLKLRLSSPVRVRGGSNISKDPKSAFNSEIETDEVSFNVDDSVEKDLLISAFTNMARICREQAK